MSEESQWNKIMHSGLVIVIRVNREINNKIELAALLKKFKQPFGKCKYSKAFKKNTELLVDYIS